MTDVEVRCPRCIPHPDVLIFDEVSHESVLGRRGLIEDDRHELPNLHAAAHVLRHRA